MNSRAFGIGCAALALGAAGAQGRVVDGRLTAPVTLTSPHTSSAIRLALDDLARDFRDSLGGRAVVEAGTAGDVVVRLDPAMTVPESHRIAIGRDGVTVTAADPLGAAHGIYRVSELLAGIGPLDFWKGRPVARRDSIALEPRGVESRPAAFRYRGWFVNDEDLLTGWKPGGGERHIDYPFYAQVVAPEVADRVFEALLRCGGNLVIPASFVDVMNPPEAALVARAAARGLFVTQHHIEPLGVSHFGFETYWKARGQKVEFAYGAEPERLRETWRAFAARWVELAGDRVVWQLGLRGRGDRPVWANDKSVTEAGAGRFISRAIADQWAIVRSVDPRPHPPATTTLWMEGSDLMRRGALEFPEGVIVVFADEGRSQAMQADFHDLPRRPGTRYGVYHHVGFWAAGPHLVQGVRPDHIGRVMREVAAKGDTEYAIINVCNVREHVLGVEAATALMDDPAGWNPDAFLRQFAPAGTEPLYRDFLAGFVPLPGGRILQDGYVGVLAKSMRAHLEKGGRDPASISREGVTLTPGFATALRNAIGRLDGVLAACDPALVAEPDRGFVEANLLVQAHTLRGLYRHLLALMDSAADPARLADAEAALREVIDFRARAAGGPWTDWFRGDTKMNLPAMMEATGRLRERTGAARR